MVKWWTLSVLTNVLIDWYVQFTLTINASFHNEKKQTSEPDIMDDSRTATSDYEFYFVIFFIVIHLISQRSAEKKGAAAERMA